MTLTLTQEQLDSLLREAALGGAAILFCLWVAARALVYFVSDVRQGWKEGTQLSGEGIERLKKRGEI